jgi:hypothetical protein
MLFVQSMTLFRVNEGRTGVLETTWWYILLMVHGRRRKAVETILMDVTKDVMMCHTV